MRGAVEFGSYFEHVAEWYRQASCGAADGTADANILFLQYEDMKADLPGAVVKIARFIGRNDVANDAERVAAIVAKSTFDAMKANPKANFSWLKAARNADEPEFLRKGVVGDWASYFTPQQIEQFDAAAVAAFGTLSDLKFRYE